MSDLPTMRRARLGEFVDAYPAGAHDLEMLIDALPTADVVQAVVAAQFENDPRCRRVIFAVPEDDVPRIAWAEAAGFRYVVDVEVRSGVYSLLVAEPGWVSAQPHVLDDIPLKE